MHAPANYRQHLATVHVAPRADRPRTIAWEAAHERKRRKITVTINGKRYEEEVEVRFTLADFMRQQLGLTGTHLGCEHGVCGACTILFDGLLRALLPDARGAGRRPRDPHRRRHRAVADKLHPLQEAFRDNHGLQCGFCTPGMLTTLIEFLRDNPDPTEKEVRIAISGNLCRCTGYQGIVDAALDAAKRRGARQPHSDPAPRGRSSAMRFSVEARRRG